MSHPRKNALVSAKLCCYLFSFCTYLFDDDNFEEADFVALMNMKRIYPEGNDKTPRKIKIASTQAYKFCYVLHKIAIECNFTIKEKREWLDFIYKSTTLNKTYYNSYCLRVTKTTVNDRKYHENSSFIESVKWAFECNRTSPSI